MAAYEVPQTADDRRLDLKKHIDIYTTEYTEFKDKVKKAAGSRAKKALTVVKKLITAVRKDIQAEIDATKKQ